MPKKGKTAIREVIEDDVHHRVKHALARHGICGELGWTSGINYLQHRIPYQYHVFSDIPSLVILCNSSFNYNHYL